MAVRWKGFSGKEHKDSKGITAQEIHNIVSREVSAASMKNQVMNYIDEISALGIRTEAVLDELKESCARIEDIVKTGGSDNNRLDSIADTVERVAELSESLEASIHRDNLISYQNIKETLEQLEENNKIRAGRLRVGIIFCTIISSITLISVVLLILMNFEII